MYWHLSDRKLIFLSLYYFFAGEDAVRLQENVLIKQNLSSSKNSHLLSQQRTDLRKFIAPMLDVQCSEKSISINYRFNRRYARFMDDWYSLLEKVWLSWPKLGDDLQKCTVKNEQQNFDNVGDATKKIFQKTPPAISIFWEDFCDKCCGISTIIKDGTVVRKIRVKVSLNTSNLLPWIEEQRHQFFDVSCTSDQDLSNAIFGKIEFVVANADTAGSIENFSPHDEVLFHTELRDVDKFLPADLKTFPVDCWLDTVAQSHTLDRRYFLADGCPSKDNQDHGLSSVSHFASGYTRVGVKLSDFLTKDWFRAAKSIDIQNDYHRRNVTQRFTINCRLLICVHSNLHAVLRVPKCPSTTYCSATQDDKIVLPDVLKTQKLTTAQSKHLNFIRQIFTTQKRNLSSLYNKSKLTDESTKNTDLCQCPPSSNLALDQHRKMCQISFSTIGDQDKKFEPSINRKDRASLRMSAIIFAVLAGFLSGALLTVLAWHRIIRFMLDVKNTKFRPEDPSSEMRSFRADVSQDRQISTKEYKNDLGNNGYLATTSENQSAFKTLLYNEG